LRAGGVGKGVAEKVSVLVLKKGNIRWGNWLMDRLGSLTEMGGS